MKRLQSPACSVSLLVGCDDEEDRVDVIHTLDVPGCSTALGENEWWHFNAMPSKKMRAKYDKLDIPLDAVEVP